MTRPSQRAVVLGSVLAAGVVELLPWRPAVLVTVTGLWLVFGAPAWLCRRIAARIVSTREAQWLLGLGFAVLTAMVAALAVNTVLPWFGVSRPLTTASLAGAQTLAAVALAVLDRRLTGSSPPMRGPRWMPVRDVVPIAILGALTLVVAAAGAVRLNNGFSGATSLIALFLVAALLGLLAVRANRYGDGVIALGILCAATALLLLTSLRGWYVTGHDVQREFLLFQLTSSKGYWDISGYPDPYHACLSITLLPASVAQLTALPGLAIFKVVLPMLFAAAPVAVYRTTRNLTTKRISLLAAICFLAFPTFFTDMPFLGRQEIAFLLLGCAVLALSDRSAPRRARRVAFTVLFAGIVLSHYSTTYVLIAVLVLGKLASGVIRVVPPLRRRLAERTPKEATDFVAWPMLGVAVACSALWTGPVTGTWHQLQHTAVAAAHDLFHPDQVQRGSSDTAYSIFSSARVSPEQRLQDYAESTRPRGEPPAAPVQVAPADNLPLTRAGSALDQLGLDVPRVNSLLRTLCADGLQVLLLVGLAGTLLATATVFRPTHDLFVLAAGGLGVLAAEIALPQLSVDYGVLRTFQQGLFGFAPFIAMGSVWALWWLKRWRMPAATAVSLLLFLDLTGALPRLFGGYPAQLQLDNAGQYYDIYYAHPQERAALAWLERHTAAQRIQSDRYTLSRLQTLLDGRPGDDIYPTLVQPGSFVLLGYPTVRKDEVTVFYQGDLVTYRYPLRFLDATKNKVYSSNGTSVYR
ncbi:hypothetical protein CU254_17795 [Amycolatopsis sp. AA4]|uniref:DUF2206 domain-containing protein n=1 Tax=Actinomycetes TaxID=1760 RepID=UPI0001B555A3|nr:MULTISPECIES: DUF2206 domain-containing protein [Actinomycetes]ATY12112.1 hypothetical protein CU254_17795 [Amycolatopsis sp. AA4]EFL07825.1 predicted protein [Streptomyces sp. AA4]